MTQEDILEGLKPAFWADLVGTAKAVPYPKPIFETTSNHCGREYVVYMGLPVQVQRPPLLLSVHFPLRIKTNEIQYTELVTSR